MLLLARGVASCHEPAPKSAVSPDPSAEVIAPDASTPPAGASSSAPGGAAAPSAPEAESDRQLAGYVCKSAGCRVASEEAAGVTAQGLRLSVVKVVTAADMRRATCEPLEYWSVARDGARIVSARRALSIPCDASTVDIASDDVRVRENELERLTAGGTATRYNARAIVRLFPLRSRTEERSAWMTTAPNFETSSWSLDEFAGKNAWFSPKCVKGGVPPAASGSFAELGDRKARHDYTPIPAVDIEESFRTSKWRQVHLGKCSALASATGASGFVLKGGIGTDDDGYFRVVASLDGDLFVDIKDNKWTAPKKRGDAREDQLEIWVGGDLPSFSRKCVRGLPNVTSFTVRVADGKLTAGYGKPDISRITVDRHAQTFGDQYGWAHFKIHLPAQPGSLTVVYRDGDDGRSVDRIFATSRVVAGDATTLGALHVVARDAATCKVKDGNLEPVLAGD